MDALPIALAVLYAALTGLTMVIDRVILNDVLDTPGAFLVTGTTTTFLLALGLTLGVPVNLEPSAQLLGLFIVFGLFKSLPIYAYLRLIRRADASTVSPIISTQPALTVVLAFLLLSERLTIVESASVVAILIAILLLAVAGLRDSVLKGTKFFNRNAMAAAGLAFVWSFEAIVAKYTLGFTDFWTLFFWSSLFAFLPSLVVFYSEDVRADLKSLFRDTSSNKFAGLATSEAISSVSALAMVAAYEYGRITIVVPVLHTYSVFVFIFIITLHLIGLSIDTKITGKEMKKKAIATILAFTAIIVLALI